MIRFCHILYVATPATISASAYNSFFKNLIYSSEVHIPLHIVVVGVRICECTTVAILVYQMIVLYYVKSIYSRTPLNNATAAVTIHYDMIVATVCTQKV